MKTIGLIGGTSWESTAVYYRLLNEGVRRRLGGLRSASIVMVSVDFAPLAEAMGNRRWDIVAEALAGAARQLVAAGADCIALCSNTMHKVAAAVREAAPIPLVSLVDVTGDALAAAGVRRPLLLATRYTMEHAFYRDGIQERHGIVAAIPDEAARGALQRIIFDELCLGLVRAESKADVSAMIDSARREGCDGVIFGCTEIGLLLSQADLDLPAFETTELHCEALLNFALTTDQTAASKAA